MDVKKAPKHDSWWKGELVMAVNTDKTEEKLKLPPAVMGAIVVVVILIAGVSAYLSLRPPSGEVPKGSSSSPLVTEGEKWMRQKAVEAQGDFSKLSQEDQNRAQAFSQGRGERLLKYYYDKEKREHGN